MKIQTIFFLSLTILTVSVLFNEESSTMLAAGKDPILSASDNQNNSLDSISSASETNFQFGNSFFIAITSNDEMYAFPISDIPQPGQLLGIGNIGAVADFDNDGLCEVLAVRREDRLLRLYENDDGMGFTEIVVSSDAYPATNFSISTTAHDSSVGDFDNNGFIDFSFSGRRCSSPFCMPGGEGLIQLHLNMGNGSFERHQIDINGILNRNREGIEGLDDGRFNPDSFYDLAAEQYWNEPTDNITHLLSGNGEGSFVDQTVFTTANSGGGQGGIVSLVSGDFNTDGHLDMIVGQDDDGDAGQTWLYLGNGNGEFTYFGQAYDTNPSAESGADHDGAGLSDAYDFDSDGNLDVIAPAQGIGLLLYKGNGDGSFQDPIVLNSDTNWFKVATQSDSSRPCGIRPFLDLPVDYEGRTENSPAGFRAAFNNRVTSKFDHRYPYFTNSNFNCEEDPSSGIQHDNLLTDWTGVPKGSPGNVCTCVLGQTCYDGHDAYDIDDRCSPTDRCSDPSAVYPAANGEIIEAGWLDNILGCQIKIDHGDGWITFYAHLQDSNQDHNCDGILRTEGYVSRFEQIGIIGKSGSGANSEHLHFVTFHNGKVVDPSGWEPHREKYPDPWEVQGGAVSNPIWRYDIYTSLTLEPAFGGQLALFGNDVISTIPPNFYSEELTFSLSYDSVPKQSDRLESTGYSFSLTAIDDAGNFIHQLNTNVTLLIHFDTFVTQSFEANTLSLFSWDSSTNTWSPLPTTIDSQNLTATAQVSRLSTFALMAQIPHELFLPMIKSE